MCRLSKNTFCALCLWALGLVGIHGIHHFYTHRTLASVIWFTSLGIFGIGWIYDLCQLNEYVYRANGGTIPRLRCHFGRFMAQLILPHFYYLFLQFVVPRESDFMRHTTFDKEMAAIVLIANLFLCF